MAQVNDCSNAIDMRRGRLMGAGAKPAGMGRGTVVSPVGVAARLAADVTVGGLADTEMAESVDPTEEDTYWRDCYAREWYYEPGRTYDDYRPAYEFGLTCWNSGAGAFDTVEPELENKWNRHRGTSGLDWAAARHATRAAWDRAGNASTYESAPDTCSFDGDVPVDKSEIVNVLNELVETSHDGEYGFRASAVDVESPNLKQALSARAEECGKDAHQLGELIRRFGGTPAEGGTAGGALERGWMRVKGMLGASSEKSILDECERGEGVAAARYRAALEVALPADVLKVVKGQAQSAQRTSGQMEKLRSGAQGSN